MTLFLPRAFSGLGNMTRKDTALQLAKQGLNDLQVAIVTGLSPHSVRTFRYRKKVPANSRYRLWTKQEEADLRRLVLDGDRRSDIGLYFNRDEKSVQAKIKQMGLANKYNYFHGKARLWSIVWLMEERGYPRRTIARRLSMTESNVSRICSEIPKKVFNV